MSASGPPTDAPISAGHLIESLRFNEAGLIPAVAQDWLDGAVLMVAWMNQEAIECSLASGEVLPADLIVLATGYKGQEQLVRRHFGDEVAGRVGPIWGFDDDRHELRNMFVRTGQPGLWFIAGSFAQCRIWSKYLALQIKACEEGLCPLA